MTNFLNHLIADEVGTSAFLATLLDQENTGIVFEKARRVIAEVLKKRIAAALGKPDAELGTAPKKVEKEYLNIDLVVVWSPWTILIENKVAAASVTRGQLCDYYEKALQQIDNDKDKGEGDIVIANQPICFIYLTPTKNTGVAEFESLKHQLRRSDIQVHMEWKELLEPLKESLTDMPDSFAFSFLTAGLNCVENIIEGAKNGTLPDPDGRRDKIRTLMNNLKERIQNGYEQTSGLVFCRWSDQRNEQLFARGPTQSAYVTLYVSYDRCQFPSDGRIQASGDISFEVASKHRTHLRGFLAGKPQEKWCKLLGIASIDTRINLEKGKLTWGFSLQEMPTEEFLLAIEGRFLLFASVFRETLVEVVDPKTV